MERLQSFLETLWRSSTRSDFYAELLKKSWGYSWQYFFLVQLLLMLIVVLPVVFQIAFFDLYGFITAREHEARLLYPDDLVVVLTGGVLTINHERPYRLPLPDPWKEFLHDDMSLIDRDALPDLVLFLHDDQIHTAHFEEHRALFIVGDTVVYAYNEGKNEVRGLPFSEEVGFTLMKSDVDGGLRVVADAIGSFWLLQKWAYVPLLFLLLGMVRFTGGVVWTLITLVFFACVMWIVCLCAGWKSTYGTVFRLSIHTITPIILLNALEAALGLNLFRGILVLVAYLFWTFFVFYRILPPQPIPAAKRKRK